MKGVSLVALVLLFVLVALLSEIIVLEFGLSQTEALRRSLREQTIIGSINTVELVKRHQKAALSFSFYKAYEMLGSRGGYYEFPPEVKTKDCIPYWQIYVKNLPSVIEEMRALSLKIFNSYMDLIKSKEILIPIYNEMEISDISKFQRLEVKVSSEERLKLEEEKLKIAESADFSSSIADGLLAKNKTGVEKIVEVRAIRAAVKNAIAAANLPTQGKKTACGVCPTHREVFEYTAGMTKEEAEKLIKDNIANQLKKLAKSLSNEIKIGIEPAKIESEVAIECGSCTEIGCCEYKYCTNPCCYTDPETGECVKCEYECGCITPRIEKECNFHYYGAADVLVTIDEENKRFPIGNQFKTTPLKFRAVDGNYELITEDELDSDKPGGCPPLV